MQATNAAANRGFSLIQDCGYYSSSCGYCRDEESSISSGMHAHRLTVYDYQELLDQGWRRSGKFLYKPDNAVTCCRQYTIRLDVTEFQPTKAQRKLLRKWDHFLAGTYHQGEPMEKAEGPAPPAQRSPKGAAAAAVRSEAVDRETASPKRARTADGTPALQQQQQQHQEQQPQQQHSNPASQLLEQVRCLLQAVVQELQQSTASGCDLTSQLLPVVKVLPAPQQQQHQQPKHKHSWPPGTICTSPCAHALAAAVRKHTCAPKQQQQPQQQQQQPLPSLQAAALSSSCSLWTQPDQLASNLADRFNNMAAASEPAVALTAVATRGHINFLQQGSTDAQQQGQTHGLQQQSVQQSVQQQQRRSQNHGSHGPAAIQQQQQQQHEEAQTQAHRLEVRMVPNQFIQEEFELWQRYQAQQHHDALEDLTPRHYKGFLVDTPLIPVTPPTPAAAGPQAAAGQPQQAAAAAGSGGMPSCGYGSFHQQYWLDGKLVAVGVVDVLPRCLSSKYFFWDPDHAWLSLGRYGALREISWVADQHAAGAADLRYYYLGYYIHTCPKMAYKAEYSPSELLCPKRQVWVRISDTVRQALDRARYVVLSDLPGVQMQQNLSVPRVPPAAAAVQGGSGASSAGDGSMAVPEKLSREQQIQQRQRELQALDAQLLFVMKQPVRWGALRDSGVLDDDDISLLEEQLTAWRAAVGETSRTLLYATAQGLLSF